MLDRPQGYGGVRLSTAPLPPGASEPSQLVVMGLGLVGAICAGGLYVSIVGGMSGSRPGQVLNELGLLPFVLQSAANLAVVLGALQAKGRLDAKLSHLIHVVLVVHGIAALIVLITHQPHSNTVMLTATAVSVALGGCAVFWKHFFHRTRIGVVGTRSFPKDLLHNHDYIYLDNPDKDVRDLDVILIPDPNKLSGEWSRVVSSALLSGTVVRHVEQYAEELRGTACFDHFEIDHVKEAKLVSYRLGKRCMDIVLVAIATPFAIPILVLAMVAIRLTMGPGVIFVQTRVGQGGVPFRILKLRTMIAESEMMRQATTTHDARITPLGHWLRRFRIDELPQLWNVLRGEMSIIGPRPEWDALFDLHAQTFPAYHYRNLVRPGITGWAQVRSGYAATSDEVKTKLNYDLYYVKNLSFGLDVQILIRTVWILIGGQGAR